MYRRILGGMVATVMFAHTAAEAQSLRGSRASLDQQNRVARQHDFTFLQTPADVRRFVASGYLVPVRGNQNYQLASVSFPYARPEVLLFVERLSAQYRSACGEPLVVTSLTRPLSHQPRNASPRSVHPTGMALDLRVSQSARCRNWLERTLLSLEGSGVLNATRERNPPHYHVAVFPRQYAGYVERLEGGAQLAAASPPAPAAPPPVSAAATHRVAAGETLWSISRRYGTTVAAIQTENGLRSSRIHAGQTLRIPGPASGGGPTVAAVAATHRVARGETLWSIAGRYGTSVAALQRANGLTSSRIHAGQTLRIPGADGALQVAVHQVSRGDTLWNIARRHGTTIEALIETNNLSSSRIHPGQTLQIPQGN